MKKFLLLAIIAIGFTSCNYLPTGNVLEDPYIVISIERFSPKLCKYIISTETDYLNFKDNVIVIDSIGKYVIGDSVILLLNYKQ